MAKMNRKYGPCDAGGSDLPRKLSVGTAGTISDAPGFFGSFIGPQGGAE
jgi:hypothetical protein